MRRSRLASLLLVLGLSGILAQPAAGDPGGPILVVSSGDQFGRYYAEILRAEGLNEFNVTDLSNLTPAMLGAYDVVILGHGAISAAQATTLNNWVQGGGNLIAMRPDPQLSGLLGLSSASGTLSNAYLRVDTATNSGAGIVGQTIQFHGTADRYTAGSAQTIATLYSNASTATANPAVTLRGVGANGGQAAAFTYDLARSVVYTRQGNPAWAGQERDGQPPIRSDDLFFGAKAGDVQPDWVDLNKVAIPQADEQQHLLTNLIEQMNVDRKPLPRFWFLPRDEKAAVVMTGDDHANGGTEGRFNQYQALGPPGCSVANWECVRATSYIYTNTGSLTNAEATAFQNAGFEIGLHPLTNCNNWTDQAQLESIYSGQLSVFASTYPGLAAPVSSRTHCIVWSDWATQPKVELENGIRLDTNYYYWPDTWVDDRPGMFTGSGMPMRFADLDGSMIDVYQATTQMTDESGQSYPFTIDTLLDRALGPEGYYGVFTANMHNDQPSSAGADAIIASARARGVPIVSARQMLNWLDARNASSFGSLNWASNTLSFTISGPGANGLRAMVPTTSSVGALTQVTRGGTPIGTTTKTVKGREYAVFNALSGSYQAFYATPQNGKIVFSSRRDGNDEIYSMNANGSAQTRLTTNPASDYDPAFSPTAGKIAFTSKRNGNDEIYVMNADGSAPTRLTTNSASDAYPVFSPNGQKIAFTSTRDNNSEIYVMNANGSAQTRLTTSSAFDGWPSFSGDSQKIAFTSTRDGPTNFEIYVMNANGSAQTRLTNDPGWDLLPGFSADSQKIAFTSSRDGNAEIYLMNANGSGRTRLTSNLASDTYPAFSPNGQKIAFSSNRDGNDEIYSMNASGTAQTRLTSVTGSDGYPNWGVAVP